MLKCITITGLSAFLFAATTQAVAQSRECRSTEPDRAIIGCSQDIQRATANPASKGMLPVYYSLRAAAYEKKDMLKEAKVDLDTAVLLQPGFRAYFNRAVFSSNHGSDAESLSDYKSAIAAYEGEMQKEKEAEPFYAQANFQVGENLRRREQFSEALPHYDKAVAAKPDDREILFNRALVQSRLGNNEAVIADLTKVVDKDGPHYVSGLMNRSTAYLRNGNLALAIADMDKAVAKEPQSPLARVRRALVLERLGEPGKAVADYREALKLYAGMKEAQDGLARLTVR
jgi:tetratricopeptide (TPR) repeat protein